MMQNTNNTIKRKSRRLNEAQKGVLKRCVASFDTVQEAAEHLGVSRQVLDRVLLVWRGSPESIERILGRIS